MTATGKTLGTRLLPIDEERLKVIVTQQNSSASEILRLAVLEYLDRNVPTN